MYGISLNKEGNNTSTYTKGLYKGDFEHGFCSIKSKSKSMLLLIFLCQPYVVKVPNNQIFNFLHIQTINHCMKPPKAKFTNTHMNKFAP